jgi:hypothetical protein
LDHRFSEGAVVRKRWMAVAVSVGVTLLGRSVDAQQLAARVHADRAPDSVRVVANDQYQAGGFHRLVLGDGYRDVWAAPLRVPVLNLDQVAGGLLVVRENTGHQTRALELKSRDGREFRFRSADKDPVMQLSPAMQKSMLAPVFQDYTSALFPGAAAVAARLADAAGIPHTAIGLFVMPDDPRLGKYREEFAGMLGILELYPSAQGGGAPGITNFRDVVKSEKLAELLNASPHDQVEPRSYLATRLFDMFANDADRHPGQWRWGTRDRDVPRRWVAIPLDRDNAFSSYGGLVGWLARLDTPQLVPFTADYRLRGLTRMAADMDARLLAGVERPVWDSIATELRGRLTDSAIAGALAQLPDSYYQLVGPELEAKLRSRRDKLPEIAARYYERLAQVVDVHGTDAAERAEIRRQDDGSVEVQLRALDRPEDPPYFRRRFVPVETREVRVYLHGGADQVDSSGTGPSDIKVRVICGSDSAPKDALDRRPWRRTPDGRLAPPLPDRDHRLVVLIHRHTVGFRTGLDVGMALRHYGFERRPYGREVSATLGYSLSAHAFGLAGALDLTHENSALFFRVTGMASDLQRPWFYGFGNQTPRGFSSDQHRIPHREYIGVAEVGLRGERWSVSAGPIVKYSTTGDQRSALAGISPARGSDDYGEAGVRGRVQLDTRASSSRKSGGLRLSATADVFPRLWNSQGTVAILETDARMYLPITRLPLEPVLALRAGARRSWGPYPWFDAAFVGGKTTLRGYGHDRFAGDAAAYAGADLRLLITRFAQPVPGELGVLGLADAGRVWLSGENSDQWHHSWGGGIWTSLIDPSAVFAATVARGAERTALYLTLGYAF